MAKPLKYPVSALVVLHDGQGHILLIERADRPGFWQSVTGSIEQGESIEETARREVWEETGIHGEVFAELGVIFATGMKAAFTKSIIIGGTVILKAYSKTANTSFPPKSRAIRRSGWQRANIPPTVGLM